MSRSGSPVTEGRTLAAMASLPLFGGGAPPNNMAPNKSRIDKGRSGVVVLQQGIDTIYFSVTGVLREDVVTLLEWAKESAQEAPGGEAQSPLPPFFGVTPRMQAKGAAGHEWKLESPDVVVLIRRPNKSRRPAARIEVQAPCLWREGLGGLAAARLAEHYLRGLFEDDGYSVKVARVDLATDFQGHDDFTDVDRRGVVKRAHEIRNEGEDKGGLTWYGMEGVDGFSAGKSSECRINYYNKSKRAKQRGQDWYVDLWSRNEGYVPGRKVNRCEFQFGRSFLHNRAERLETLADVEKNMARLWAYGVRWFSVRTPSETDSRKSRWAVADWWLALSLWRMSDAQPLGRIKQVRPKFIRVAEATFGYMTTAMALVDTDCPHEALECVLQAVRSKKLDVGMLACIQAKRLRYDGFTMADA